MSHLNKKQNRDLYSFTKKFCQGFSIGYLHMYSYVRLTSYTCPSHIYTFMIYANKYMCTYVRTHGKIDVTHNFLPCTCVPVVISLHRNPVTHRFLFAFS